MTCSRSTRQRRRQAASRTCQRDAYLTPCRNSNGRYGWRSWNAADPLSYDANVGCWGVTSPARRLGASASQCVYSWRKKRALKVRASTIIGGRPASVFQTRMPALRHHCIVYYGRLIMAQFSAQHAAIRIRLFTVSATHIILLSIRERASVLNSEDDNACLSPRFVVRQWNGLDQLRYISE